MNTNADELRTQAVSPLLILALPSSGTANARIQIRSKQRVAKTMESRSRVAILPCPNTLNCTGPARIRSLADVRPAIGRTLRTLLLRSTDSGGVFERDGDLE